jgi:hypothetical protein
MKGPGGWHSQRGHGSSATPFFSIFLPGCSSHALSYPLERTDKGSVSLSSVSLELASRT